MPPRQEDALKAAFHRRLRAQLPGFVINSHQDVRTSGVPDDSILGNGKTSWLEYKHGVPSFDCHGLQLLTCCRFAEAGFCRYVIWQEPPKRTLIVHPAEVKRARDARRWSFLSEVSAVGFDHDFLVDYIRSVHGY